MVDRLALSRRGAMAGAGMMALLADRGFTKHTRKEPGSLFVEEYWK